MRATLMLVKMPRTLRGRAAVAASAVFVVVLGKLVGDALVAVDAGLAFPHRLGPEHRLIRKGGIAGPQALDQISQLRLDQFNKRFYV